MSVWRPLKCVMAVLGVAALCSGLVVARAGIADAVVPPAVFGRADYPAVGFPTDIESADFNADGISDLVVVDGAADTVSVLLGVGDGTFAPRMDYPTGRSPQQIALGDVNGDSILDVVAANWYSGDVSVFRGAGNGTFIAGATVTAGGGTGGVALGDLNGDSILDMVASNYDASTVSVFRGVGDGTFTARRDDTIPYPGRVALADLDGDSRLDMAVTDPEDNTVSVFRGMGDGTFGPGVAYETLSWPVEIVAAHLNADSILDLAVADYGNNSLSVLPGMGDGTFGPRADLPLTFSNVDGPMGLVARDLNGDSILDLAAVNDSLSVVQVLWGLSDAAFTEPTHASTASAPRSVTAADFNGDGRMDLAAATSGFVSVLLNQGAPRAPGAPTNLTATAGYGNATVSWTRPASDGGLAVTGYVVTPYRDGVAQAPVTFNSPATTQTLSALVNGAGYTFTVAATNAVGTGPESDPSNPVTPLAPTPPGAPTMDHAAAANQTAVVYWRAPASNGGSPLTGYVVTPYVDGIAQAPVTFNTTYLSGWITGLTNGVTYTFTVAATNAVGTGPESAHSNPVTPVPTYPQPPTILRNATAANQSATVSWLAPASDGGSPIIGYVVVAYVGYGPVKFWVYNSTATTQTVTGLTNGTEYRFRVLAYNAVGFSDYSKATNPVTPTP